LCLCIVRRILKKELDLVDVDLDLRKIDVGLIDDEWLFLPEEFNPLVMVLVAQEGDGLEDGRARLKFLRVELVLIVEGDLTEGSDLDVTDELHFLGEAVWVRGYIFCSLVLSLIFSSVWFLTLSKEKT
jgi:hypothetical protein